MIENDEDVAGTQAYIERLQTMLCLMRKSETPANYILLSKAYLHEITEREAEIRAYLSRPASENEAADIRQVAETV